MPDDVFGIVGIGLLGSAIASRLLQTGYFVSGFDIEPDRLREFQSAGGNPAGSAVQVAGGCRRVLLSLPDANTTAHVLDEIESHLAPGSILIDTTTGDPEVMMRFGERLASRGIEYLDATVGGSSHVVRTGQAIIMAGGSEAAYNAAADVFASFASRSFHLGPCGAGARMKLVLNLVLGLNRAVLAEGLAFSRRMGIEPSVALEILKAGPAYSRAMDDKGEKMLARDFRPQARLAQHLKDVRLILDSAARCGAATPLSEVHRELLELARGAGYGDADNSAIIEAFD